MAFKIEFDSNNMPITPSFLLTKRNGSPYGIITNLNSLDVEGDIDTPSVSFKVTKDDNGIPCAVWDDLVDFKLIYCIEWNTWFDITVSLSDGSEVVKSVNGTQLEQTELSQIKLYNIEINTEDDIERDDYVASVVYNPENTNASILHRILADKAPHYTIVHVDDSLKNIQRTFSFDGDTIKDALNTIAEEINAVVIYGEQRTTNREPQRTISLYDLSYICNECGYRGEIFDVCPECGSTDISSGYGNDTTIFVSKDNLTDEVDYSLDSDSVKNCFKLTAGDELMTATVANYNPNGSAYIWYFSDDMKNDMPSELVEKLNDYDELYEQYSTTYEYTLTSASIASYNSLITKYDPDNYEEREITSPLVGFESLTEALYKIIDFELYINNSMCPSREITTTTASEQVALLTGSDMSPVSPANYSSASKSTIENYVLNLAKVIIDYRYKVELNTSAYYTDSHLWVGSFKVTNQSDDEDTATGSEIIISITDDYANYMAQKVQMLINKKEVKEYSLSAILEKSVTDNEDGTYSGDFITELRKYNLAIVKYIQTSCQSIIDILGEASVGDDSDINELYDDLYEPYYTRLKAIEYEISIRDNDAELINTLYNAISGLRGSTQSMLNLQSYIGETLWNTFCSYRREDEYTNDNYISDGLTNSELVENAKDFLKVAKREILKSATSQHRINSTLKNLLTIKEFQGLVDYFELWNWLRIEVDGEIYKLRLVNYSINYSNLENISVTFSDVVRGGTIVSDSKSIYSKLSSMATTYNAITRQASNGTEANAQLNDWKLNGVYTSVIPIISGENNAITQDEHGMLFRAYDSVSGTYDNTQLKIFNSTLSITDDNWKTVKAAVGKFRYTDPETNTIKNAYGVNGETIVGKLILGDALGIYNSNASLQFNGNGLVVANNVNTITINPNDDSLFTISNSNGNIISFDSSGNGIFSGNLYAEFGKIGGYYIEKYNLYTQFSTQEEELVTRQIYDDNGNPIYNVEYEYDENGNPVYETDENGNIVYNTEIQYDSNGNIVYELALVSNQPDISQDVMETINSAFVITVDSEDYISGTKSTSNPARLEPITSFSLYRSLIELFKNATFVSGTLDSQGEFESDSSGICIVTNNYIAVMAFTYIIFSAKRKSYLYKVFAYDENYNLLSSECVNTWSSNSTTFKITNAAYVKVTLKNSDDSVFVANDDSIFCVDNNYDSIDFSLDNYNIYSGSITLYDWYSFGPGIILTDSYITSLNGGFTETSDGIFEIEVSSDAYEKLNYSSMYDIVLIDNESLAKTTYAKKLCVLSPTEGSETTSILIYDTDFASVSDFNSLLATTPMQLRYSSSESSTKFSFSNTLISNGKTPFCSSVGELYECDCTYLYEKVVSTNSNGNTVYDDDGNIVYAYNKVPVTVSTPVQKSTTTALTEDVLEVIDSYYDNYTTLASTGDIALSVGSDSTTVNSAGNTVPDPTSGKIKMYNTGEIYTGSHTISDSNGSPTIYLKRTRSSGKVTTAAMYSTDFDNPAVGFKFKLNENANFSYSIYISKDGIFPYSSNLINIGSSASRIKDIFTYNLDVSETSTFGNIINMRDDLNRLRPVIHLYNAGTENSSKSNLVVCGYGNMFVGGGESSIQLYNNSYVNSSTEHLFLTSDYSIYFVVNCQNLAKRRTIILDNDLNLRPQTNALGNLGTSIYRWNNIFSAHGMSSLSDERIKKDLKEIYKAKELLMGIKPYQYRFTSQKSDRIHYGFSSQQFKATMDELGIENCGAWTVDVTEEGRAKGHTRITATEDEKVYGLRYEELIAPIVQVLQEYEVRLNRIEKELNIK